MNNDNFSHQILQYTKKKIKTYKQHQNLKQLRKIQQGLSKNIKSKTNIDFIVNKVDSALKSKFYTALENKNFKKAKRYINAGLTDQKQLYNKAIKAYQLEKKYKIQIKMDIRYPFSPIVVKKKKVQIGTINNEVASCNYERTYNSDDFTKKVKFIVNNCKKNTLYCKDIGDGTKCLNIQNYKANGYIKSLQRDTKQKEYMWSAYTKDGILIDEYDNFKNELDILRKFLKGINHE